MAPVGSRRVFSFGHSLRAGGRHLKLVKHLVLIGSQVDAARVVMAVRPCDYFNMSAPE